MSLARYHDCPRHCEHNQSNTLPTQVIKRFMSMARYRHCEHNRSNILPIQVIKQFMSMARYRKL